ncbi:MAG TPA: VacJ family lipoprotein [Caulobacteraceae bacterium]|nr:VacJ family lipoprotein [Caulobacteraceae bacterium]
MRRNLTFAAAAVGALLVGGAAYAGPVPASGKPPPEDPFEAMNRSFYASHNGLDRAIFLPLARLYRALTPGFIGEAIHNGVTNLSEPVVLANDILQGRFKQATRDALRITANSTAGFLGVMDVATPAGLPHHDNDFGITLGRWGVKPGPYLFVPILGPTTVRDTIGEVADIFMNPLLYMRFQGHQTLEITAPIVSGLDTRYRAQTTLTAVLSDATDPYATLRSLYLQSREALIRGENAPPLLPPLDEPATDQAAPPPASSGAPPASDRTPTPADQTAPPPTPSATASPPAEALAEATPDPDAPIATARPYDLQGGPSALRGA